MARDLLSPVAILDATHGAVSRIAAPWLGVLWLAVLPHRFAQVYFVRELLELGRKAPDYGGYLETLAWIVFGTFLPAVLGRAVYVRACLLGLQSGTGVGTEALRVPPAQLINTIYTAFLIEVLSGLTVWLVFTIPLLAVPAGLLYAAATRTRRPGLVRPVLEVLKLLGGLKAVLGLAATFLVALPVAFLNLYMAFRAGIWAVSALGGDGMARWEHLIRPIPVFPVVPAEPLTLLLCAGGALLIVEPFWLASLTVYVHRAMLRQSGEDLRLRFRYLARSR